MVKPQVRCRSATGVLEALRRLRAETTILLIAHRIATVRWADLIYVIEDGSVVESGAWDVMVPVSTIRDLTRYSIPN